MLFRSKDTIEALGLPATAGSLALAGRTVAADAPLVANLRAAGAVILGSTNVSEWANIRSPHSSRKRRAATIGPTVWELEGPMPILNKSNTLMSTSCLLKKLLYYLLSMGLAAYDK